MVIIINTIITQNLSLLITTTTKQGNHPVNHVPKTKNPSWDKQIPPLISMAGSSKWAKTITSATPNPPLFPIPSTTWRTTKTNRIASITKRKAIEEREERIKAEGDKPRPVSLIKPCQRIVWTTCGMKMMSDMTGEERHLLSMVFQSAAILHLYEPSLATWRPPMRGKRASILSLDWDGETHLTLSEGQLTHMTLRQKVTGETLMISTMTLMSLSRDWEPSHAPTGPMMTKPSGWISQGSLVIFSVRNHRKEVTHGQEQATNPVLVMRIVESRRANILTLLAY